VVIGVIALLMAMLVPALERARNYARTIICQSNLRQWGSIFAIYLDEHDGNLPTQEHYSMGICVPWLYPMRDYLDDIEGIHFCPMATQLANPPGQVDVDKGVNGGTFLAWGKVRLSIKGRLTPFYSGSYGLNSWVYEPTVLPLWGPEEFYWRTTQNAKGVARIPVLLDSMWWSSRPRHTDGPTRYEGGFVRFPCDCRDSMNRFCINRHDGYINASFLDQSVRRVGLKELWTLKWHREYNTAGPWTKAGGVKSTDWPEWMRNFKDY
jgi:hypothetical protein